MPQVHTSQGNIAYREVGNGSALVFLHGVGSDITAWDEQIATFGRTHRAIAVEYPGYPGSDLPAQPLDRAAVAATCWEALAALDVQQATLIGLSMGGVIALEMWRQQPDRITAFVLADTFAWHPQAQGLVERSHTALQTTTLHDFATARVGGLLAPGYSPENAAAVIRQMGGIDPGTYHWATIAVWTPDFRADLPLITQPTLILVGEHDHLTPIDLAETLHVGIPHSQLEVIPGAGHISNMDQPQIFDKLIADFLAQNTIA